MNLDGGRRLISVPYTQRDQRQAGLRALPAHAGRVQADDLPHFDVLYREGAQSGRVMAIALHPYISGVPHRIDALDAALEYICKHHGVWRTTGSEIARHYVAQLKA